MLQLYRAFFRFLGPLAWRRSILSDCRSRGQARCHPARYRDVRRDGARIQKLACTDKVLMLAAGKQQAFGPKDEVLSKVLGQAPGNPGALKVVQTAKA